MIECEAIADIDSAGSISRLHAILQSYIESKGFAYYAFVNNSHHGTSDPLLLHSVSSQWDADYRSYNFLDVDPCLPMARVRNTPFIWADAPKPARNNKKKTRTLKMMEAAADHELKEGLVVPVHYRGQNGEFYSSVCTLFWSGRLRDFHKRLFMDKHAISLVLIYWCQAVVDLIAKNRSMKSPANENLDVFQLTEREREVLSWAALGKTNQETADILNITSRTVVFHMCEAMKKLGACNKTHAVTRAIQLHLIQP